jgi:PAS domain S-box-containing protein
MNLPEKTLEAIQKNFFEQVPFNVVILDRERNVVSANKKFKEYFGEWNDKKCYEVCKKSEHPCTVCRVGEVFETGEPKAWTQAGYDCNNNVANYVVHAAPIKNDSGEIEYVIKMSSDLMDTKNHEREFTYLFENAPSFVTIIDDKFNIVSANKKFRDVFGDVKGKHCFEVYKKRKYKCRKCPAINTFKDGQEHASSETGKSIIGDDVEYMVSTSPLSRLDDKVVLVLEIATDMTEIIKLQNQINHDFEMFTSIIDALSIAVVFINDSGKLQLFNNSAKKLFAWSSQKKPGMTKLKEMLPLEFFAKPDKAGKIVTNKHLRIIDSKGKPIDVRFTALEFMRKGKSFGRIAIIENY